MTLATCLLDLVFVIDCTISLDEYMENAINQTRMIIYRILKENTITVRFALIKYRDHPPQGGGDGPEAVADALNDALNLPWNPEAVKICILISDAPPHGYEPIGDSFPQGCPYGHDSMLIARNMAPKNITLYTVGVEPPILPYRGYFELLARFAGGEYISLENAYRLTQMIVNKVLELSSPPTETVTG